MVSLPAPPSSVERDQRSEAVTYRNGVVAAAGAENQVLGSADVEGVRCRTDAIEAHPRAIGRDGERLGAVAAVDFGSVIVRAALEQIGAVARIPDHPVIAGVAEDLVISGRAEQDIVVVAAVNHIASAAANEDVVAIAAIDGELDLPGNEAGGIDESIGTSQPVDGQRIVGGLLAGDQHLRGEPAHHHGRTGQAYHHMVGAARAVDDHRVGRSVAGAATGCPQVDLDPSDIGAREVVDDDGVGAAERVEVDLSTRSDPS